MKVANWGIIDSSLRPLELSLTELVLKWAKLRQKE